MRRLLLASALLLAVAVLSGCLTRAAIEEQISLAGEEAFRDWQATRTAATATPSEPTEPAEPAQTVISGGLSMEDAVKLTLAHNRAIHMAAAGKQFAKGVLFEAYSAALPRARLDASYTRMDEVSAFEFMDMRITLGALNNYSTSLTVEQPIFHGGAMGAALRAARLYDTLTDQEVRNTVQDVVLATIQSYYTVVLLQDQVEVASERLTLAEAHRADVEVKKRYGVASRFHQLRSEVDVSAARAELLALQNRLHQATTELLKTMGVAQESRITLSDPLRFQPVEPDEEEVIAEAFRHRPDLAAAELTTRLQTEALKVAYSRYWPQVDLFYTAQRSRPDPKIATFDQWGSAWRAGVRVQFHLFDGLAREGRVRQERAALKQSQIALLDTREQVLFEIRASLLALQDAREAHEAQQMTLQHAAEGLRLAEVGYREGTLDQVSVLEARTALSAAQLRYHAGIYDHTMARLRLQRAAGALAPRGGEAAQAVLSRTGRNAGPREVAP